MLDKVDPKAVVEYVNTAHNNLRRIWDKRNAVIRLDREMINLVEPPKKEGVYNWTLNKPKVLFDTIVALLSSQPPRFRMPLTYGENNDSEKEKMNKSERFVVGMFRELNHTQIMSGRPSWFRELAYWICQGMAFAFVSIKKKGSDVTFISDLYDPMTCYPLWTPTGLKQFMRAYDTSFESAESLAGQWGVSYDKTMKNVPVTIKSLWEDTPNGIYNVIVFDDKVIKPVTKELYKTMPVIGITVGSPDMISPDWETRVGESVIAANRAMYKHMNELISLQAEIVSQTAFPNLLTWTQTGKPPFESEDVKGHGTVIPLLPTDKVDILKHAASPIEVDKLIGIINQCEQQGGLPNVVYGGLPFEISGFALSQLLSSIRYRVAPYATAMQEITSSIASEFLRQVKVGGFGKISIVTANSKGAKRGQFFIEDFEAKDVPDNVFVDVSIPLTVPMDKTQQIMFSKQAVTEPAVMSLETIWDDILDIQDSEGEQERMIDDKINRLPVVAYLTMKQRVIERMAAAKDAQDKTSMALLTQIGQVVDKMIEQQMPQDMTKATNEVNPGVPPSVLPPEAGLRGEPTPDEVNVMQGTPEQPVLTGNEGGNV